MGIFDKMFGSGAHSAQDANSQKRFEELKQKYQSVGFADHRATAGAAAKFACRE
jgi:hypothetical protein